LPADIEQLRKVLELEHKKGYLDSAVIGGLDKFLRHWAAPAMESVTSPRLLKRFHQLHLIDSNYASLDRPQRKEWVRSVVEFLAELEHSAEERPETQPAPIATRPSPRRRPPRGSVDLSLDSPITLLRGISQSLAAKFKRLGVTTIRDLLYFFPHRHLDYSQRKTVSQLAEGKEETIVANVCGQRVAGL